MKYRERIEQAILNFKSGYNCSQSVVLAFSDLYNLDKETALRVSASFGAGTGRMRLTCGAASGMFLLAGMEKAALEPNDRESKGENYRIVQELAGKFKSKNKSLICGELLNLKNDTIKSPIPEERTKEYYSKRPCVKMVESAATIFAEYLESKE